MALCSPLLLILPLLLLLLPIIALSLQPNASLQSQSSYLSFMKQSLAGPFMSRWDVTSPDKPLCSFSGIACDAQGRITTIDLSSWSLVGSLPPDICASIPSLRTLRLPHNDLRGGFSISLLNCFSLEELNLSFAGLTGPVPDLSPMHSLRILDLSNNLFSGSFPVSITNLTNLEIVNFNENPGFDVWRLPESITSLTKLQVLILSTSSMRGEIPRWLGNMTSLTDLELCGNLLTGKIPPELGKLKNLRLLELYYNLLTGEIPEEIGNLTNLGELDCSVNQLTGRVPEKICALPSLRVLQLYTNSLTGGVPPALGNSSSLKILSIYRNFFSGPVPATLGKFSELVVLELSENQFTGELPPDVCAGGKLLYILVLGNRFSGSLPESYGNCPSLLRFRVNNNQLSGRIPGGVFGLPHASIIDLGYNQFEGEIAKSIGNANNLSALFLQNNRISGALPVEISWAIKLVKIDISNNMLTGPIPSEVGRLNNLNQLSLQGNRLNSSIPESLSSLGFLNVLNLSNNLLTGEIPESLCGLLPNSLDFSNNQLTGPVPLPLVKEGLVDGVAGNPGLCIPIRMNQSNPILPLCPQPDLKKRLNNIWIIAILTMLSVFGILLVAKRWFSRKHDAVEQDRLSNSSSFFDVTSFHKLSFDQHEIVEALIEKNIVGHGGSGTVYKIELSNGELVAVKKLWSQKMSKEQPADNLYMSRELRSEVETLGSIRHKNIVKLYCCFSSSDSNLLVYEYMPNGNLWDALHKEMGWRFLDWPTRHRIAVGIAQGLAYLHHDLLFPIVHRDIKTSNILLDAEFEPKVADFGIAKVLQAGTENKSASTTVIAGTYGYLAPGKLLNYKIYQN